MLRTKRLSLRGALATKQSVAKLGLDCFAMLAMTALFLSACSFSRDGGYSRQFALKPAHVASGQYRKGYQSLKVRLPSATPELDTDRIALVQFGGRQDYIANAKWADFLPVLVQSALVQSFAASGRYANVMADDTPTATRYVLATDIEHFEIQMASGVAPAIARIRLRVKLLPGGSSRVLHEEVLEISRPVHEGGLFNMMRALDGAFGEVQSQAIAKMGPR